MEHDYSLRGKCKEYSEKLCKTNPELVLTKGWYVCPVYGKEEHWWCKHGEDIVDPTAAQFPSLGTGEYIEFDGFYECAECSKQIEEDSVTESMGRYVYCSGVCHAKHVGLYR